MAQIEWVVIFPILAAITWGVAGPEAALPIAIGGPVLFTATRLISKGAEDPATSVTVSDRIVHRAELHRYMDNTLKDCGQKGLNTAALMIEVHTVHHDNEDAPDQSDGHLLQTLVPRVSAVLRGGDAVFRTGDRQLTVVLAPTARVDLDVMLNVVDRVQAAIAEPVAVSKDTLHVSSCVGFCSDAMAPASSGVAVLTAADCALRVAMLQGKDAVRAFNMDLQTQVEAVDALAKDVPDALENGDIQAWFQPQINVRTGEITGFETLARWEHPELGTMTASQFLHAIRAAGQFRTLGDVMLKDALEALKAWDEAGLSVPTVTLNLSLHELNDPRMSERIIWQVDRSGIAPERVAVEIPEQVAKALGDEVVAFNLDALVKSGFQIDMDRFGSGTASIAHLKRFKVRRIKLDRDLVLGLDVSEEKTSVVRAVLGLARDLGIEAIATGAETESEREALLILGCQQMQGFGVAQPMALKDTVQWAMAPRARQGGELRNLSPIGNA